MSGKQAVLVLVCLVVIAGAVYFTVRGQSVGMGVPDKIMTQPVEGICGGCDYTATIPLNEFRSLDEEPKSGFRKCPECGAYHFSTVMTCASCGEKIPLRPRLVFPPEVEGDVNKEMAYIRRHEDRYECPKCGENAKPRPGT